MWAGLARDPMALLAGAALRLPPTAVFSGLTAAWLHGLDVEPCAPIDVTVPHVGGISARSGLAVSRAGISDAEVVVRAGYRVTSAARTVQDVSLRLPRDEAVVVADMALQARLISLGELAEAAAVASMRPGIRRFRQVVQLADAGAESPMETRLRLALMDGRLPRPETQAVLTDSAGNWLARVDLYYPDVRLAIEYDGEVHLDKERLVEDHRRQNRLLANDFGLLRYTGRDLRERREGVQNEVRAERQRRLGR